MCMLSLQVKVTNWLITPKFVCTSGGRFHPLSLSDPITAELLTALGGLKKRGLFLLPAGELWDRELGYKC